VRVAVPWFLQTGQVTTGLLLKAPCLVPSPQPALTRCPARSPGAGPQLRMIPDRIARAAAVPRPRPAAGPRPADLALQPRQLTFAYGPHAEPVVRDLRYLNPGGTGVGPDRTAKAVALHSLVERPSGTRRGPVPAARYCPAVSSSSSPWPGPTSDLLELSSAMRAPPSPTRSHRHRRHSASATQP
jgi:ATP-binding cassette subfamily C protein